ncbi:MAG: hypothetical protein RL117_1889 [Verrucomicrobiota bacterium]|jgi:hypothetical protein
MNVVCMSHRRSPIFKSEASSIILAHANKPNTHAASIAMRHDKRSGLSDIFLLRKQEKMVNV